MLIEDAGAGDGVIAQDDTGDTGAVPAPRGDSFSAFFYPPDDLSDIESSSAMNAQSRGKETSL